MVQQTIGALPTSHAPGAKIALRSSSSTNLPPSHPEPELLLAAAVVLVLGALRLRGPTEYALNKGRAAAAAATRRSRSRRGGDCVRGAGSFWVLVLVGALPQPFALSRYQNLPPPSHPPPPPCPSSSGVATLCLLDYVSIHADKRVRNFDVNVTHALYNNTLTSKRNVATHFRFFFFPFSLG